MPSDGSDPCCRPASAPWVTWIFVAMAIGAFVVILIGGIQRYRRMRDEPDDDRDREDTTALASCT